MGIFGCLGAFRWNFEWSEAAAAARSSRMSRKVLERLTSGLTASYRGAGFQYIELHLLVWLLHTGTSDSFKKACSLTAESFWFEVFWFFYVKRLAKTYFSVHIIAFWRSNSKLSVLNINLNESILTDSLLKQYTLFLKTATFLFMYLWFWYFGSVGASVV